MRSQVLVSALSVLLVAAVLAAPGHAGDFYVSSQSGNNANDGQAPATAWRSITYALANVPFESPTGLHTIHVAPGTYSVANGETFPLRAETPVGSGAAAIEIVSTDGSSATTMTTNSFAVVVVASYLNIFTLEMRTSRILRLEGFRIQAAEFGIRVSAGADNLSPRFADLILEGGTGAGFVIESCASTALGASGIINDGQLTDCEVSGFALSGIEMRAVGDQTTSSSNTTFFLGTTLRDNGEHGLLMESLDGSVTAIVQNCRFTGNAGSGCELSDLSFPLGGTTLHATRTLFADNRASGVALSATGGGSFEPLANLSRCTAAGNGLAGILAGPGPVALSADTCVFFSNATDVQGPFDSLSIEYSDVGTGTTGGAVTNISLDPRFVDPASGDYRLQDGSPCVDAGNPVLASDPDGTTPDMGAFFFDQGAVASYCTGKTNSLGCVPFVAWTGFASTSAPQPFALTAHDVLPSEAGLLVYGFQAANLSFHGGKLCVKAPLQRYLPVKIAKATGAPPCSGTLTRNFNARIQSGVDAMLTAGQTTYVQWRLRDAADPAGFGDGLTDAARFLIAP